MVYPVMDVSDLSTDLNPKTKLDAGADLDFLT